MTDLQPHLQRLDREQTHSEGKSERTRSLMTKFKVCLLGDFRVGKTSLIQRFVYNVFSGDYLTTIGMKVTKKEVEVPFKGRRMVTNLLIWDIMGNTGFRKLHSLYYQSARGAIVVSDVTRKGTLDNISNWISRLYEISPNIPLVIVANKNDLIDEAEFTDDDVMEVAEAFMAPYYFTSAKTGENVDLIFKAVTRDILKQFGVKSIA